MNITSILITIIGIIIILALYVASRMGQRNLPKKETSKLPEIHDEHGQLFTSILDDIPASEETIASNNNKGAQQDSANKNQFILFISAKEGTTLDGNLIKEALIANGLILGDKNIYHYYVGPESKSNSLFRIANGVEPWTLTDKIYKTNKSPVCQW